MKGIRIRLTSAQTTMACVALSLLVGTWLAVGLWLAVGRSPLLRP